MIEVQSKTFKSGNSEALRLPKEVAFGPGVEVTIRRIGDELTITPKRKRTIADLVARLQALPRPDEVEEREPIEFPERPGL